MPDKKFRVNIFRVEAAGPLWGHPTPFRDAIETVASIDDLGDRQQVVGEHVRRLENYLATDNFILLNLVNFLYAGPSTVRDGEPLRNISLRSDESFAFETAMLYDFQRELAFVESSMGRIGPSTIGRYFATFLPSEVDYVFIPILDAMAAARARRFNVVRSLEMRVALGPPTEADRDAGLDMLKAFSEDAGYGTLEISLKAVRARRGSLSTSFISRMMDRITGTSAPLAGIEKLRVRGKEDDEDQLSEVDLLQHRESRLRTLPVDSGSRKIPRQSRWRALQEIRRDFLNR